MIAYCQEQVARNNQSGLQVLLAPGEYNWGNNSVALNKAILLIAGYLETKNQDYYNTALEQLHYILGVNGHALSFVTGVGEHSVQNPHHRPSGADGIQPPVPGLLVGGPNQFLQDAVLSGRFTSSTPPALCYVDDVGTI